MSTSLKNTYLNEDFLLHNPTARALYHDFAEPSSIVDYHNHLSPRLIAEDAVFNTITRLWLDGDHYKWRLMRANGIDEQFITGNADDEEKFLAWAETVSRAVRNPLFDWAHLELKRYFGISDKLLSRASARALYAECNERLCSRDYSARNLLRTMNIKVLCTTDDPVDNLAFHAQLRKEQFEITVLPTFRPDKALALENPVGFNCYLDALSEVSGIAVTSFASLMDALENRHGYFHEHGCRCSDISLATMPFELCADRDLESIFTEVRAGKTPDPIECVWFKTAVLLELCRMNHKKAWAQQFHFGVIRNARTSLFSRIGPDAGGDCMGDFSDSRSLCRFLDHLDESGRLAKTILYSINPRDNELLATIAGSFQDGSVPGKIQLGPAWWFMDHKEGILRQLNALSNNGLLSRFIGMTTDSRSILSFVRHEYFRRILCNCIGEEVERGELPNDPGLTGALIKEICFTNAGSYFNFPDFNRVNVENTYDHKLV